MIPPHLLIKESLNISDIKQRNNQANCRSFVDYSYIVDLDILRLMGFDVPPIRRGCPPIRGGVCFYRDNYTQKGAAFVPQSLVVPYCRSSIVFNTSLKRNCQVNKDLSRSLSDVCQSVSQHSDGDNPHNDDAGGGSNGRDDSSEDSYKSSTSDGNKGVKRTHGSYKGDYHYEGDYQYQKPVNGYHSQGNRWQSDRRSPPRYNVKYNNNNRVDNKYGNNNNHNYPRQNNNNNTSNNYGRRLFPPGNRHVHHQHYPPHLHHHHHHLIPPDRFLAKVDSVQVVDTPECLTNGSQWDGLSKSIWNQFIKNQQTADTFRKKITLWRNLFIYIRSSFPRYGLFLVGSTMSGFGRDTSDVDMCLLIRHSEMDQRNEAVTHLGQVLKYLRVCGFVDKVELIQAKVPILKFRGFGFEVDLNCNNSVGIRNTHLLYCYAQLDWRVRPLVLFVKLWAAQHNINDAKNMTVSSYSLSLMVIHFLQCGVAPAVLPCLHSMYNDKFSPHSDIVHIDLHEELPSYKSENDMTLGQLLVEFLRYYAQFDYNTYAISVRLADRIPIEDCRRARSYKNDPHQWKYLCIEEPFDLTNTARSVYDLTVFERIKTVFNDSYVKIKQRHCLDTIYQVK